MADSYFRAAVGAFIVNNNGQMLVVLKHKYFDKWHIVKGGLERGETELEALKREIIEELGDIKFKILKKSMISSVVANSNVSGPDYIGQARNNYWVLVDSNQKFDIPNNELEKYKWIDIDCDQIKKHFGIHDEDGVLQTLLPFEWREVKKLLEI